jgi:hypothetical protein
MATPSPGRSLMIWRTSGNITFIGSSVSNLETVAV